METPQKLFAIFMALMLAAIGVNYITASGSEYQTNAGLLTALEYSGNNIAYVHLASNNLTIAKTEVMMNLSDDFNKPIYVNHSVTDLNGTTYTFPYLTGYSQKFSDCTGRDECMVQLNVTPYYDYNVTTQNKVVGRIASSLQNTSSFDGVYYWATYPINVSVPQTTEVVVPVLVSYDNATNTSVYENQTINQTTYTTVTQNTSGWLPFPFDSYKFKKNKPVLLGFHFTFSPSMTQEVADVNFDLMGLTFSKYAWVYPAVWNKQSCVNVTNVGFTQNWGVASIPVAFGAGLTNGSDIRVILMNGTSYQSELSFARDDAFNATNGSGIINVNVTNISTQRICFLYNVTGTVADKSNDANVWTWNDEFRGTLNTTKWNYGYTTQFSTANGVMTQTGNGGNNVYLGSSMLNYSLLNKNRFELKINSVSTTANMDSYCPSFTKALVDGYGNSNAGDWLGFDHRNDGSYFIYESGGYGGGNKNTTAFASPQIMVFDFVVSNSTATKTISYVSNAGTKLGMGALGTDISTNLTQPINYMIFGNGWTGATTKTFEYVRVSPIPLSTPAFAWDAQQNLTLPSGIQNYQYYFPINCSNVDTGTPIIVNGSTGFTIGGQKQIIWTTCQPNLAFYYNSYSNYVIFNLTSQVPMEVNFGNVSSYQPTLVWGTAASIYHMDGTGNLVDSANHYNATMSGTIPQYSSPMGYARGNSTDGHFESAYQFNGAPITVIAIYSNPTIATNLNNDWYKSMFVNFYQSGYGIWAGGLIANTTHAGFGAWYAGTTPTFAYLNTGGVSTTAWKYIAGEYPGKNEIYFNGSNTSTATSGAGWIASGHLDLIGYAGNPVSLIVDELFIYNETKSDKYLNDTSSNINGVAGFGTLGANTTNPSYLGYNQPNLLQYQYRTAFQVYKPTATTQAYFPAPIQFNSSALVSANKSRSDCLDNIFTDVNNNLLNFDFDSGCNAAYNATIWVSIPSFANNTTVYMYYGYPGETTNRANATGVWRSANYVGAYHAQTNTSLIDSAGYNDLTLTGNATIISGKYGNAVNFIGQGEYAKASAVGLPSGDGDGTESIWFVKNYTSAYKAFWGYGSGTTDKYHRAVITDNSNNLWYYFYTSKLQTTFQPPVSVWYYMATRHNNSYVYMILNTTQQSQSQTLATGTTPTLKVGNDAWDNSAYYFTGIMDEFRIRNSSSSDSWLSDEYGSYSVQGAEENLTSPGGSPILSIYGMTNMTTNGSHANYTFSALVLNTGTVAATGANVSIIANGTIIGSANTTINVSSSYSLTANWVPARPESDVNFTVNFTVSSGAVNNSSAYLVLLPLNPAAAINNMSSTGIGQCRTPQDVGYWDGRNWSINATWGCNYTNQNLSTQFSTSGIKFVDSGTTTFSNSTIIAKYFDRLAGDAGTNAIFTFQNSSNIWIK